MKNSDERKQRKRIDSRIFLKISKLLRKQFFPEETPRIAKIKFRPAVFFLFPSLFYEEKNVYYRNVLKYNPRPLLRTILFRLWRIDALFSKDRVTIFARRGEYICAKERKRGREMVKIKSDTWNVGQGDTVRCGKEAHSTIRVDAPPSDTDSTSVLRNVLSPPSSTFPLLDIPATLLLVPRLVKMIHALRPKAKYTATRSFSSLIKFFDLPPLRDQSPRR